MSLLPQSPAWEIRPRRGDEGIEWAVVDVQNRIPPGHRHWYRDWFMLCVEGQSSASTRLRDCLRWCCQQLSWGFDAPVEERIAGLNRALQEGLLLSELTPASCPGVSIAGVFHDGSTHAGVLVDGKYSAFRLGRFRLQVSHQPECPDLIGTIEPSRELVEAHLFPWRTPRVEDVIELRRDRALPAPHELSLQLKLEGRLALIHFTVVDLQYIRDRGFGLDYP